MNLSPRVVVFVLPLAGCGGSSSSLSEPSTNPPGNYRVLAANDLGMHCMDRDFSVYSILPPFNVVNAQVLYRRPGARPQLLDPVSVQVSYEGVADASGSINTRSAGKTGFWDHAHELFGAILPPGMGLTGLYMPGDALPNDPQPMGWIASDGVFRAFGIPITPTDDAGAYVPYPLLRIRAQDPGGSTLATTDVVVPVATETDCRNCHVTGGIATSDPGVTWSSDPDLELQSKWNVLLLHDFRIGTQLVSQAPVLCASCHYSPPLDLAGAGDPQLAPRMSIVMHSYHGGLTDSHGDPVFPPGGSPAQTCYQCHPGVITQCLRGAMATGGLQCFNCHGDMRAVGGDFALAAGGSLDGLNDGQSRRSWMDLPRCQSCHTGDALTHLSGGGTVAAPDGIRLRQAWRTGDSAASPILASNSRFAENADKLFRYSKGHGGVSCEGCHGSTHAEWPNADAAANDNVAAMQIQGHAGPIMECVACHAESLPANLNGPHGMHPIGGGFAGESHGHLYQQNPAACRACHGADLRGTVLSRTAAERTFHNEDGSAHLPKGTQVACNSCHSMP